jgi:HSP20 family protein
MLTPSGGTIRTVYRDDVDRLFAELFPRGRHGASTEARAPVDAYVAEGDPPSLVVEIDAAGVDPDRVDIALRGDVLVVRGERRRSPAGRRVYHHAEIAWGPFERRLRLGVPVDGDAVTASYEAGILRIALPLAPKPPLRRVDVTSGGAT